MFIMKSDMTLQEDVMNELKWEPSVNAAHIGVEAKNGVVTLSGHVDSLAEKWNAERAAKNVAGVKVLAVELDVKVPNAFKQSDTDIAEAIHNAFEWSSYIFPESLKAKVERGYVTLTGEVEWQYLKWGAENAVRYLKGVTGVNNMITLTSKPNEKEIRADIEDALKRRAQDDAKKIKIAVQGDEVILTGSVHTWPERNLATSAVWGVPGVHKVVDRMVISP
jgi:osmotically-inducible protein OsmY